MKGSTNMSKGPGAFQVKVMAAIHAYQKHGEALEWEFQPNQGHLSSLASEKDIEAYARCERIPLWILIRDFSFCKAALSRALKGLESMGYVQRFGGDLDTIDGWSNVKYAALTAKGMEFVGNSALNS
jgi:hypothetical protein